jgi:hypothetical protein
VSKKIVEFAFCTERFVAIVIFISRAGKKKMRACFLGQNICNLGYGVAVLQAPRLVMDELAQPLFETEMYVRPAGPLGIPEALIGSRPVANPPRPEA